MSIIAWHDEKLSRQYKPDASFSAVCLSSLNQDKSPHKALKYACGRYKSKHLNKLGTHVKVTRQLTMSL